MSVSHQFPLLRRIFNDVARAGSWVVSRLKQAGLANVRMIETESHLIVYGDWLHAASDKPTVLIYGHFDVQPAEPLDLWDRLPFNPILIDETVRGRGASDDKGEMLIPILAAEALLSSEGKLPVNVNFFFEGQEEIGFPTLQACITDNSDLLKVDMIFSAEGGQWGEDQPSMIVGLKALARPTLELNGIWRGYLRGKGTKTVLPAKAYAKITCRLVANQEPEKLYMLIKQHIQEHTPRDISKGISRIPGSAAPFLVPSAHNSSQIAAEILSEVYGKASCTVRIGGSIPATSMLLKELGVHATVFAFGLNDEKVHAPNEFFRLSSFRRGQEAYCKPLHKLGLKDQA